MDYETKKAKPLVLAKRDAFELVKWPKSFVLKKSWKPKNSEEWKKTKIVFFPREVLALKEILRELEKIKEVS